MFTDEAVEDDIWSHIGPGALGFDHDPKVGSGAITPQMLQITRNGGHAPLYSPDNPLFWFAGLLLLATGAIYVSTSFKLGPAKASVSI